MQTTGNHGAQLKLTPTGLISRETGAIALAKEILQMYLEVMTLMQSLIVPIP